LRHPIFGLNFLRWFAHSAIATLFVLYTANRYGLGPAFAGTALAVYGVFDILVQAFVVRRVIAKIGERGALLAGLAFGCITFAIFGLAPNRWWFALGLPFLALIDLFGPGFLGIVTRRVSPAEQGRLQGAIGGVHSSADLPFTT
jgi:DHA1 family tetracycline resistance protein-like MFS transporter